MAANNTKEGHAGIVSLLMKEHLSDKEICRNSYSFSRYYLVGTESLHCVRPFATLWTIAHQATLSMGFFRQEYWSGLSFPPPGDIPGLGIQLRTPAAPALPSATYEAQWPVHMGV